ncbi:methyl-accepting chemotaxis protein [Jatrophihabitans sp. GAS493]|uniref:methyl-accepting chemotaxis protein n=1 Tax=Jatrophihabitans sp. GAS493 TaxID=1907575 RepID=UPI000BB746E0|nr:methyl-accepting chemotaxis protein [Jatrophihabitans sp. GAS493]SOD74895.1 methyl-accepting chemotaxis protein [Jatrophihabitans sp. GAS493]
MQRVWTSWKIGTRLAIAFALVCALCVTCAGVGLWGLRHQSRLSDQLIAIHTLSNDAASMKFYVADETGWQSYEAMDVAAYGPVKALAADDVNVQGFADDEKAINALLTSWHSGAMSASEAKSFAALKTAWDSYFATVPKVEALWRQGTPASFQAATAAMNTGFNSEQYSQVVTATDDIQASIAKRSAALQKTIHADTARVRTITLAVTLAALAVAIGAAFLVTRSIVAPLKRCVATLRSVAAGDLTVRAEVVGHDEVTDLAEALNRSVDATATAVSGITRTAEQLSRTSASLTSSSTSVIAAADDATRESGRADVNAGQVTTAVNALSVGGEEMHAAISEISRNTAEAARVAASAVELTSRTAQTMTGLDESSDEIGAVVKLINAIAAQTNLLALNATIEAARAGELGKGFAVVANEVKALAQKTEQATNDIAGRVTAIQHDAKQAVNAIGEIDSVIGQISDFQTTIASAVEEQTATTADMSRWIDEVSGNANLIAENVGAVVVTASSTRQAIDGVQVASVELAGLSSELDLISNQFTL